MSAAIESTVTSPAPGWYCLRVPARREQLAARNLRQRTGVPVFAPSIRVPRAKRDGASLATEALFPGYVFARFRYPQQLRHVASTPGVLQVVALGGPPRAVADAIIERLDDEVRRATAATDAPQFEEGAWVRIVAGCFSGSEGRVLAGAGGASRVSVLLHLLGQDIQLSVSAHQLADVSVPAAHLPAGLRSGTADASSGR